MSRLYLSHKRGFYGRLSVVEVARAKENNAFPFDNPNSFAIKSTGHPDPAAQTLSRSLKKRKSATTQLTFRVNLLSTFPSSAHSINRV
jgi:hypothetical protein